MLGLHPALRCAPPRASQQLRAAAAPQPLRAAPCTARAPRRAALARPRADASRADAAPMAAAAATAPPSLTLGADDSAAAAAVASTAVPKRRIAVFVEPSPFSHTSGMKNRFLNLIANLTEQGDEVRAGAWGAGRARGSGGAKSSFAKSSDAREKRRQLAQKRGARALCVRALARRAWTAARGATGGRASRRGSGAARRRRRGAGGAAASARPLRSCVAHLTPLHKDAKLTRKEHACRRVAAPLRAQVLVFTPDNNPPATYCGAQARAHTAQPTTRTCARAQTRGIFPRAAACAPVFVRSRARAPPPPLRHVTRQVVGLAGVPLPFYKSDTLLLSPGISLPVWAKLRDWKPDLIHVACPVRCALRVTWLGSTRRTRSARLTRHARCVPSFPFRVHFPIRFVRACSCLQRSCTPLRWRSRSSSPTTRTSRSTSRATPGRRGLRTCMHAT
jgi:hypothetical protein